jgi:hypothetical protein
MHGDLFVYAETRKKEREKVSDCEIESDRLVVFLYKLPLNFAQTSSGKTINNVKIESVSALVDYISHW